MSRINAIIILVGLLIVIGLANDQASVTQMWIALGLAIVLGVYSLIASSVYRSKKLNKEQQ